MIMMIKFIVSICLNFFFGFLSKIFEVGQSDNFGICFIISF